MTDEQKAHAIQLRSEGMPYLKIAAKIGVSESCAFKFLKSLLNPAKPEKTARRKAAKTRLKTATPKPLLPVHHHVASVPMRRHINPEARHTPQLTKAQMYYDLARAVRATARL
jgi:hypothetical protein